MRMSSSPSRVGRRAMNSGVIQALYSALSSSSGWSLGSQLRDRLSSFLVLDRALTAPPPCTCR